MATHHTELSLYHGVHPWQRLKQWLKLESTEIWVAAVYTAATGLVSLMLPIAVQAVVNTVAFGTLLQPLVVLTLLVFVALTFVTVLNACRHWVVELIQRRIFVRMAGEVTHKLLNVEPGALDRHHGPELVNRFLEVVTVQKAGAGLLMEGLTVMVQTVIGMMLLGVYHPFLLAFDVLLVASILLVVFPLGAGAIPTSVQESKAKYGLVAWLEEVARHQIAFKSGAGAALALRKTNGLVEDYLNYRGKHFRVLMRQVIGSYTLQALASATLLGVGGWLVISRQMTLGQLVAAEIVVALVVSGFTKFGKHLESFYDLMASLDKLGYLTDLPVERETGGPAAPAAGGAAVRMVGVSVHAGHRGKLLEGVNLELEAGARVALVGGTGSGKSTLLDLLYGLKQPHSGYVEIDGRDCRDVKLTDLRNQVGLVREPQIFEGAILENLQLGDAAMTVEQASAALAQVGLLDSVLRLPGGLGTKLSTGGLPLSPGQRVQLEVARALAHHPRLLILDECLDWLDDLPQRGAVIDFLFDRRRGWTLIVVTHAQDILERCDRVYQVQSQKVTLRNQAAEVKP
jgi:ABC-type bacteriocin/lantibiotic exporter with double-glycine peptidase domain